MGGVLTSSIGQFFEKRVQNRFADDVNESRGAAKDVQNGSQLLELHGSRSVELFGKLDFERCGFGKGVHGVHVMNNSVTCYCSVT